FQKQDRGSYSDGLITTHLAAFILRGLKKSTQCVEDRHGQKHSMKYSKATFKMKRPAPLRPTRRAPLYQSLPHSLAQITQTTMEKMSHPFHDLDGGWLRQSAENTQVVRRIHHIILIALNDEPGTGRRGRRTSVKIGHGRSNADQPCRASAFGGHEAAIGTER